MQLLLVTSWLVAATLSAQQVEERSTAFPLPNLNVIRVEEWRGAQTAAEARARLQQFAEQEGIRIGQIMASIHDHRGARTIYLLGPGSEQLILEQPAADFGASMLTSFAPMSEIHNHTMVGDWVVYRSRETTHEVAELLRDAGAEIFEEEYAAFPIVQFPGAAEWVVGLVIAVTCMALVISQTRRYAISRLHGGSGPMTWARELWPLVACWAAGGGLVLSAAALWIALSYHGVGMTEALLQTSYLGVVFLAFALGGTLLTLGAVYGVDLLGALKGELPAAAVIIGSGALRAAAMVMAVSSLASVAGLSAEAASREESLEALRGLGGAHLMALGMAYSNEAQDHMSEVIRPWLRSHDEAGRLLLAEPQDSPLGEAMIVNRRYLTTQPIQLSDGRNALDVLSPSKVAVLIPEDRQEEREALIAEASFLIEVSSGQTAVPTDFFTSAPGMQLPLFQLLENPGRGPGERETAFMSNPMVIVTPPQFFRSYASTASNGNILVFDPEVLLSQVAENPQLSRHVLDITPVETRAAHFAADTLVSLRLQIFTTIIATGIALFAGISLAIAYGKLRSDRIFVRHLHGRRWTRSYPLLLGYEAVLAIAALLWTPMTILGAYHSQYSELAALDGSTAAAPVFKWLDLLPAIGVVVALSGSFLATLAYSHNRIIKRGIKEA